MDDPGLGRRYGQSNAPRRSGSELISNANVATDHREIGLHRLHYQLMP
jgi:hypothetical protein